jgi:hypothetical protein
MASIRHRTKTKIMGQFQAERRLEKDLLQLLKSLLSSTENSINCNRALLEDVASWPHADGKQLAHHYLSQLIDTNIRTKDSVRSFMVFLTHHMEVKQDDVIRIMGY